MPVRLAENERSVSSITPDTDLLRFPQRKATKASEILQMDLKDENKKKDLLSKRLNASKLIEYPD